MRQALRPTLVLLLLFTLLFGFAYPGVITAFAQLLFSDKANGSLVVLDGKVAGSRLIGQEVSDPKYFWGRLSATADKPYNAAASGGSNLGAANPKLEEAVKTRMEALKKYDKDNFLAVPVDLVTASGSGLDPHISLQSAEYQVMRVAKLREIQPEVVRNLVKKYTEGRQFGILGEPRVNVLLLNLALDEKL